MRKFNILKKGAYAFCGLLAAGVVCVQSGFVSLAYPNSGVINDDGVNIRSTAVTGSSDNVMKRADENMQVTVVGETTGSDGKTWLKVTFTDGGSEKTGYVREDFVTVSQTETPVEGETPQTPDENKNPDGLTPIEGLDEGLTCYFNIDGGHYFINQSFTDAMIPDGFVRVEADYRGDTIQVVKSSDIDFYLAYLTDYDDQSKSEWCYYDTEADGFSHWIKLETMQGKYLYLIDTFGAGQMDFGYEKRDLEIDGKLVEAWQLMLEAEEDLTGENDCFYYVYGINQSGNKGLYSYYTKDGTYQRNILTGLEIVDDEYLSSEENTELLEKQLKELRDKYSDDMSKRLTVICVLIVVCVLMLFVTIHLALKSRRDDEDDYEDDEDEDDYEERPKFRKRGESYDREEKSSLEKMIAEELDEDSGEVPEEEPLPEIMDIEFEEPNDSAEDDMPVIQAPEDLFEEETSGNDFEDEDADYEEDDFEDDEDEEDEEEYVKPKRRGFFFGRRRDDDYEDDYEDDEDDEDDDYEDDDYEDEDDDDYEEERMSWAESRRAKKEAKARAKEEAKARKARAKADRRNRYEDEEEDDVDVRRSNKKSKAADYAERTVTAKKSSRIPEQAFEDDDFEFEFIDLDDDF